MLAQLLQRIERGRTDLVVPLLDLPEAEVRLDEAGARWIHWVACYGDVAALRLLSNRGASPDAADLEIGENALHLAMTHNDRDRDDLVAHVLLRADARSRPTLWGTREFHRRDRAGNSLLFHQPR